MRAFIMQRNEDVTGVSGTGAVAEGVQFSDGTCAIRWNSQSRSTVFWDTIEDAIAVHGHDGKTEFIFTEELRT